MQAQGVALDGIGSGGHGTVDPEGNLGSRAALEVSAEAGRDLHRQADIAAAHPRLHLGLVGQCRALGEVARTGQVEDIGLAGGGLVVV